MLGCKVSDAGGALVTVRGTVVSPGRHMQIKLVTGRAVNAPRTRSSYQSESAMCDPAIVDSEAGPGEVRPPAGP